jgi:Hypothetical glycosyl hydrolase 6/Beta-galactosidase trimerisation domain
MLPFRQVHLDFHTSPLIADVGRDFDPDAFAATMAAADVASATVFAKCHHGLSYHPTDVGTMHPGLHRDLLGDMVGGLHARGVRAIAYISVLWDELSAEAHPEWRHVDREGRYFGRGPLDDVGWSWLCLGTPYLDHLAEQAREVVERYPVDGVFYDIVINPDPGCVCASCLRRLAREGADPQCDDALRRSSLAMVRAAMARLHGVVTEVRPDASVFFNSRLRITERLDWGMRPELEHYTHIEIESLPTGGWGYQHFPTFVRYFQTFDKPMIGMTARFHGTWSDFGTLKNRAALDYEASLMLATGAGCSIGDQLHPRGRLDPGAYELIGGVFGEVRAKEPWCQDAVQVNEVAVLIVDDPGAEQRGLTTTWETLSAVERALSGEHFLFAFVDRDADWSAYKVLVLPDFARLDGRMVERLADHLAGGGRILATYLSGLDAGADEFVLPGLDAALVEPVPPVREPHFMDVEYLELDAELGAGLPAQEYAVYGRGLHVACQEGRRRGRIGTPYFQRTWDHFSGHAQAPFDRWTEHPAAVRTPNVLYFPHPLFSLYGRHGNLVYRRLLGNGLRSLLGGQRVESTLPSRAVVTLSRQPSRWTLHTVYAVPERRAANDVIEDTFELRDVGFQVRLPFVPTRVELVPQRQAIEHTCEDGRVVFTVPRIRGHQMVSFAE